ncbi:MAG: hypothetical protein KBT02_09110 [Treponema sp.]|nr:hypothetical protein [Candidatus Treponema caballi]
MEGASAANTINNLITALGLPATVIILGVIAFFVIREVRQENASTRKSIESFKNETSKKIDELKKHSDERDEALTARFEKLEKEVKFIQHDYMTKAEHYQDTEGWKTEVQGIRQKVSELPIEILKLIKQV